MARANDRAGIARDMLATNTGPPFRGGPKPGAALQAAIHRCLSGIDKCELELRSMAVDKHFVS